MKFRIDNQNVAEEYIGNYDIIVFDIFDVLLTYKLYSKSRDIVIQKDKGLLSNLFSIRREIALVYDKAIIEKKVVLVNNSTMPDSEVSMILDGLEITNKYIIMDSIDSIKAENHSNSLFYFVAATNTCINDADIDYAIIKSSRVQFEESSLYKYLDHFITSTFSNGSRCREAWDVISGIFIGEYLFNSPFKKIRGTVIDDVAPIIYGIFELAFIQKLLVRDNCDTVLETEKTVGFADCYKYVSDEYGFDKKYKTIVINNDTGNVSTDFDDTAVCNIALIAGDNKTYSAIDVYTQNNSSYKSLLYLDEDCKGDYAFNKEAIYDYSKHRFKKVSKNFFNSFLKYIELNNSNVLEFIRDYIKIEKTLGRPLIIDTYNAYELGALVVNYSTDIQFNTVRYTNWFNMVFPDKEELELQRNTKFKIQPKFSFVIPVYKTKEVFLKMLIDSIINQTYGNFEICFVDASDYSSYNLDGIRSPKQVISEYMSHDTRIKYKELDSNGGISSNTNAAIDMATGDYIVLSDHDDELTINALYECAKAINKYPQLQLIYSDEDKINEDSTELSLPHFKPDYSPAFLESNNYMCHLTVIKRELLDKIAINVDGRKCYERQEYDGAQDYDLVLRCAEEINRMECNGIECLKDVEYDGKSNVSVYDVIQDQIKNGMYTSSYIYHIPKVLYHWRIYSLSTAGSTDAKPYTVRAGREALLEHTKRLELPVKSVVDGASNGVYHVKYKNNNPLVSVIIPNKDHVDDLKIAIKSVLKGRYSNLEIIVVENNSEEKETFEYYKKVEKENSCVKVVFYKGVFNYSKINNYGVEHSTGKYLLFLNNDTEMINKDSIDEMVSYAMLESTGIVGVKLLYKDKSIQHAGVTLGVQGVAGHNFREKKSMTYFNRADIIQNMSAVTAACMMCSRETFERVSGFSEELAVAFNDIDFCLKVRSLGKNIVYNPYATFYHYESKSRGEDTNKKNRDRFIDEIKYFGSRWGKVLQYGDPYYNENCTLLKNDYSYKNLAKEKIGKPFYMEELKDFLEYEKD